MIVDAPVLRACRECWAPPDADGTLPCGHDEGVHEWSAVGAWFVCSHPALPRPVAGRFTYPVESRLVLRWIARHRRAFRRVFAVNPRAPEAIWWVEVDPTVDTTALNLAD